MLKKFNIYPANLDGAFELISKIIDRVYPFDDCNGEYDLIKGKTNWGTDYYRIDYYREVEEEV